MVYAAGREPDPPPAEPPLGQAACDRLHSQRSPFATGREGEDLAHDTRLLVIDDEDFLVLSAASLGDPSRVAEGRVGAVPKPLAGVLAHRPMNVLGVLARLVLVKDIQELAQH